MRIAAFFAVAILALIVVDGAFVVNQYEQAIVTRFGEPIRAAITDPGLRFKLPLIEKVHRFDKRFLEWDGKVNEVQTKEKLLILVDTYARWRIIDPLGFYQRLQNEDRAQSRLDGILNGATRDAIARYDLVELVRSSTDATAAREVEPVEPEAEEGSEAEAEEPARPAVSAPVPTQANIFPEDFTELQNVDFGRAWLRDEIQTVAAAQLAQLGIELLDLQFKRINYIEDVRRTVYERMISERNRIADRFRSEGEGEALRIRGDKERQLQVIQSEAYRQAQEIVGRADAEAADIYARAYDQSPEARSFYEFLKTMETYRETFDEDTWLMLSTDGDFFRFLEDRGGP